MQQRLHEQQHYEQGQHRQKSQHQGQVRQHQNIPVLVTGQGQVRSEVTQQNYYAACKPIQNNNICQKINQGKKSEINVSKEGKIVIFANSHGRYVRNLLSEKCSNMQITSHIYPSAPLQPILNSSNGIFQSSCKGLTKDDYVVLCWGSNEIAKNESNKFINSMKKALHTLQQTNVIVVNVPSRYDLLPNSCVNKEIECANMRLNRICNDFENVKVVDISNLNREQHTKHGLHLNYKGKTVMTDKIIETISKCQIWKQRSVTPIPLH